MIRALRGLVAAGTALAALMWLVGFAGAWHPALDSVGHFRVHLALLAAVGFSLLGWRRRRWLLLGGAALVAGATVWSMPPVPMGKRAGPTLVVAQQNVLFRNVGFDRIVAVLGGAGADVLLLQEVGRRNRAILDRLRERYPHQLHCPDRRDVFGVAILSRFPLREPRCGSVYGLALAVVLLPPEIAPSGSKGVTVASFHALWPWPYGQWRQAVRLKGLIEEAAPSIVAGDFNAAPWSAFVAHVSALSGTRIATGSAPTWTPLARPLGSVTGGLSLDHLLVDQRFGAVETRLLPSLGSDHRGRVTTLIPF